jgi:hypothetical protein
MSTKMAIPSTYRLAEAQRAITYIGFHRRATGIPRSSGGSLADDNLFDCHDTLAIVPETMVDAKSSVAE